MSKESNNILHKYNMESPKVISITSGRLRALTKAEQLVNKPYKYVTVDPHYLFIGELSITVPSGFLTDGSSGGPDYGRSWLFHDWLYSTHSFDRQLTDEYRDCTRQQADQIMYDVLYHEQIYWYCRAFIKLAKLNPFWLFSRAWKNSGERGPEYFERALDTDKMTK